MEFEMIDSFISSCVCVFYSPNWFCPVENSSIASSCSCHWIVSVVFVQPWWVKSMLNLINSNACVTCVMLKSAFVHQLTHFADVCFVRVYNLEMTFRNHVELKTRHKHFSHPLGKFCEFREKYCGTRKRRGNIYLWYARWIPGMNNYRFKKNTLISLMTNHLQ